MNGCAPKDDSVRFVPFAPTTRRRQVAGALIVMAGAIPIAWLAAAGYGRPPYLFGVLLGVGSVGTLGWLVDGQRYVGAGITALALGSAFAIARETELDESGLVFGLIGIALFVISRVNPRAVAGAAGLLIYTSTSAFGVHETGRTALPPALVFTTVMLAWGGVQLRQVLRSTETTDTADATDAVGTTGAAGATGPAGPTGPAGVAKRQATEEVDPLAPSAKTGVGIRPGAG